MPPCALAITVSAAIIASYYISNSVSLPLLTLPIAWREQKERGRKVQPWGSNLHHKVKGILPGILLFSPPIISI